MLADPCPVISLCAYRLRKTAERAWELAWASLELREVDLMAANVRGLLALAETDEERDRHLRKLVRLSALRSRWLKEQRRLGGGQ